jgi:hypothetical protein
MLLILVGIFVGTVFRRSMYLLRGRQLGLRWRERVEQIVISIYNIVLVVVIYVWIDQSLYFRASLAQPSYLEAWVYAWRFAIIAWRNELNWHLPAWVQRLSSVCLSIAGSAFEVRVYWGQTVEFHSSG